ncbi:probable WRKY transcription factor protein 1 [Maniola jurtina]|uniref:probable WRKY transcription factor protein 1 n=1 Tax=Maniola jurtina TaxID=191418 RepID=UPI001E68B497|nr:probable WRKY transcription factor protein 1 [Maniola jurtina]
MLLPLYIVVALVNIFAKNNNYYIKTPRNPDFDIRVKREAPDIDFNGLTELKKEDNEKSVILDELNELLKIYIGYDENNTNSKKTRKVYSPINIVSDVDTGVGVKELNNNAKVWKEITFKIDELKGLIKHNNYDADSVIHMEGDLNSDRIELESKEKVWREIASKNIENLWNNITAEMSKLAELAVQYKETEKPHDIVFDKKVKREADSVKTVDSEESISAEVKELKNNAKAWKEIASVVDEIKDLITEYNNYSGNTPNVNIRVRRVADSTKIIDSDVNTSVGITEPKNNAKVLTEIESVLNEIQELISEYRNSISDIKEPKIPGPRVKREVNAPLQLNYYGAGLLGTMVGNALGYNKITIGGIDTKLRDRKILNIPMKNIGKSPDGTYLEKMLPYEKPVERRASKDKKVNKILPKEQEVGSKEIGIEDVTLKEKLEDGLLNKNELGSISQQNVAAEEILSKEVYPTDTRLQDKLVLLNGNEIKKIPEDKDTNPPEDLIVKFVTKSNNDEGEVKPNIDFVKLKQDTNDLKNYDGIQTYKILKAFDDIEDLLEIYVQESSVEEEKIMDDKGVIKHTESGQVYELVADYTDEHELKDDAKSITPRIKNVSYREYRTKEKQEKPLLKATVRNMKQNKSETNNRLKVTNSNSNLINHLKQITNVKENVELPKRNLLKILEEPMVLNKYRVKRDASPENRVSNFFSNIYTKVYDITHPKKDEDVNNNLLLRDDNYNSYGSLHQQNTINNNQNGGYNQYENNRINDNSLTHSDYTSYNNNNGYNNPVYNSPTNTYGYNTYGYGYGYNTPTNGFNTNAPTYNYNYANGYYYNQPINGSVYSSNGYPYNGYNIPLNRNNSNNNYNYGNGYGYNTSANNGYSYNSKQDNGYGYNTTQDNGYGYNATQDNGYGYNATQDNGYGYNATVVNDLNNNDTSTEGTIVQGCIFCGNFGCQRNYRWMGVACVPIKG